MFPIYSCFSVFNLHSGGTLVISWEKPHILKLIAVYEDVSLGKNVRGIFFPRCRINKALFVQTLVCFPPRFLLLAITVLSMLKFSMHMQQGVIVCDSMHRAVM